VFSSNPFVKAFLVSPSKPAAIELISEHGPIVIGRVAAAIAIAEPCSVTFAFDIGNGVCARLHFAPQVFHQPEVAVFLDLGTALGPRVVLVAWNQRRRGIPPSSSLVTHAALCVYTQVLYVLICLSKLDLHDEHIVGRFELAAISLNMLDDALLEHPADLTPVNRIAR
jgi:hypothetical protein